jgi:hypothetical protein
VGCQVVERAHMITTFLHVCKLPLFHAKSSQNCSRVCHLRSSAQTATTITQSLHLFVENRMHHLYALCREQCGRHPVTCPHPKCGEIVARSATSTTPFEAYASSKVRLNLHSYYVLQIQVQNMPYRGQMPAEFQTPFVNELSVRVCST